MYNRVLSVIIPVYGTEKYLTKCLDSAVAAVAQLDAEILIINDSTPDHAGEIAQRYAQLYPQKIRYYEKDNGGLADTKNFGLEKAQGEFVIFLDSDDYVEPEIYHQLLQTAQTEQADCVVCDIIRENEDLSWGIYDNCLVDREDLYHGLVDTPLMASSCNKIMKKSLLDGLRFPVGMNNEDITVTPIAMGLSEKLAHVPKGMYHYVQRENSIQNTSFSEKRFVVIDAVKLALMRGEDMPWKRREQMKGALYVYQITAVALYLIRKEPLPARYRLIKAYMDRVRIEFPDFFQNEEVWEYTRWGTRTGNMFRKISMHLLKMRCYLLCSVFWQIAKLIKEE